MNMQLNHQDKTFIVAVAAIIFKDGKILAMQRSKNKDAGAGLWETLSGRIELSEEPFDAVKREIKEECGLEVNINPRPVTSYYAERNSEPMIVIVYDAVYQSGEVMLSEEHDDFAWLSAEEFEARSKLTKLVEAVKLAYEIIT